MTEPLRLGKYEIRRELGRGAMGVVYEAFDPLIERRVAIKTTRTDNFDQDNVLAMLNRFEREAKAAGRLNHPSIVTIHDYGKDNDVAYIVMEFVPGKPLAAYLAEHAHFKPRDAVRIVVQILDALEHAHYNGVVHRDIKPANILVLRDFGIKVADFGIARLDSSTLTQTGHRLGTPQCMSPEQFLGLEVDRRTDIFSTGVILYELLTGERPFPGSSLTTIMHQVLKVEPPPPSELNATLPNEFDAVVRKALAKRPDERFQTAAEFSQALKLALNAQTAPSPQPPAPVDEPLGSALNIFEMLGETKTAVLLDATATLAGTAPRQAVPPPATARPAPAPTRPVARVHPPAPPPKNSWRPVALALLALGIPVGLMLSTKHDTAAQPSAPAAPQPVKPETAESAPAVPAPEAARDTAAAVEIEFWNSIKNSNDPRDFTEYLGKYPDGQFAGLARNRLEKPPAAANIPPRAIEKMEPERGDQQNSRAEPDRESGDVSPRMVEFVTRRAEAGHDQAMNRLGTLFRDGQGVAQNDIEAVRWFRRAAEKGNARAMNNLAVMYAKGRGVPRDETQAEHWFRRAAMQGERRAPDKLAKPGAGQ